MNLFELLKHFKSIQPDPRYAEHSKRAILATAQTPVAAPRKALTMILHIFETAGAVVFAGFFILLLTGGISLSRVALVKFSVADPRGLHAEAQAIEDMQIELANVNYNYPESSSPSIKTSSVRKPTLVATPVDLSGPVTPTSTPSSTLSIVDALEQLTQ